MSFLAMGGYAAFIWPAFGITALVLLALLFGSWRSWRLQARLLQQLEARLPRRRRGERREAGPA